jgi:hypothetical protein
MPADAFAALAPGRVLRDGEHVGFFLQEEKSA